MMVTKRLAMVAMGCAEWKVAAMVRLTAAKAAMTATTKPVMAAMINAVWRVAAMAVWIMAKPAMTATATTAMHAPTCVRQLLAVMVYFVRV